MKKLMIAAAIVCTAAFAHAATYAWSATSDWVSPNGSDPLEGANMYVFDANAYALSTISDALKGGDKSVLGSALGSLQIADDGYFYAEGSGLLGVDQGGTFPYGQVYAVIVDKDGSGNDWFYTASPINGPIELTDAVQSDVAGFAFGDLTTGAAGSTGWTQVAPEPTSGLLLLIGVAGLALRRRRA